MSDLRARVAALERQLAEMQLVRAKKEKQPPADLKLPKNYDWLFAFADKHDIPRDEAQRLYELHAIHGQSISRSAKSTKHIAIGSKGRHDSWIHLYTHPNFRSCDDCPHDENGQSV